MWTEDEWRDIVARAAPLHTRGGSGFEASRGDAARLESRRVDWRRVAAADDEALFARRLGWDDIDPSAVLSPVRYVGPMPPWMRVLIDTLEDVHPPAERSDDLPFEDLLRTLTAAARRRLRTSLRDTVLDGFEQALVRRLHWFTLRTLELEFDLVRDRRGLGALVPMAGTARYDAFVRGIAADRWQSLLREYPVLARHIAVTLAQWIDWVEEFAGRAAADADEIGIPVAIEAVPSDRHDGGRAAVVVRFDDGNRRVYKPRPPNLDLAWAAVLEWLAERGVALRAPLPIVRQSYAWFEFIEHSDATDLGLYYERAGALLCLLYILGANDVHHENLIACGDHPVLVDPETLLHPVLRRGIEPLAVRETLADSVLRVGMLPFAVTAFDEQASDFSALGAASVQRGLLPRPHWEAVNTDAMRIFIDHGSQSSATHLPRPDAHPVAFAVELERGFVRAWRIVSRDGGSCPLAAFSGARVRLLLRNTLTHFLVMREASLPRFMRDGLDHSVRLEWLARLYLATTDRPPHWPLLAAEHAALERLDIPRFTADANGDDLYVDDIVAAHAVESGLRQVEQRISRLDDESLARQVTMLRISLKAGPQEDVEPTVDAATPARGTTTRPDTPLDVALDIYARLRRTAIGDADEATWIAVAPMRAAGLTRIGVLPYDAYAGSCGTALFLAALARVSGREDVRALGLAALGGVRRNRAARILAGCGEGIGVGGIASYVYALTHAARLLDAPQLRDDAEAWAAVLASREPGPDLDVLGGMAGAICGLLALGTDAATAAARVLGERLLARRAAWPMGAGFGHGRAGIVSALSRLGLCPPSATEETSDTAPWAWCRGMAGDALAAFVTTGPAPPPGHREDGAPSPPARLHNLLPMVSEAADDSLCCGLAGTADTFLEIGRRTADAALLGAASTLVERLIVRGVDGWRLAGLGGLPRPQLFTGWCGIGALMLRVEAPSLPCHLTLSP